MSVDFLLTAILQGAGYASLAFGVYITLRIFKIPDITTDGSFTLGGAVTGVMLMMHINPLLTLIVAIASGMLAGCATGFIITKLKVQPLLAGILTMTALYSVNLAIMGRSNIPLIETMDIYNYLFAEKSYAVGLVMIIVMILLLAKLYYLLRTDFGIAMRATGDSEQMVRALGVNTNAMKIMGLALANGLTAFSGYLITQYQGFADVNMGLGIVISGLGSVMIGETIFRKLLKKSIIYSLVAVIAGSILFRLIIAAALSSGLNPNYLRLVTALIVLTIVAISSSLKKNKND